MTIPNARLTFVPFSLVNFMGHYVTWSYSTRSRSGQEYEDPLLVLTGQEYATITFEELHIRLCDALRGEKPRVIGQYLESGGGTKTFFEDGTMKKDSH